MTDWDDMRVFWQVASCGNLTAAGIKLGMTQPTVGRRLSALEERLGGRLFLREGRQWPLTEMGRNLLEDARKMADAAAAMDRHIAGHGSNVSGNVTLTTTEAFAAFWLPQRLAPLSSRHPELAITLDASNRIADLPGMEAELALRFSQPDDPGAIMRETGTLAYGLFAAEPYLQQSGSPWQAADLRHHRLIGHSTRFENTPETGWLIRHGGPDRFVLRTDSAVVQMQACRQGMGLSCLPLYLAAQFPDLKRQLADEDIPGRKLYLAAHRDLRHTAKVDALWNFLLEALSQEPTLKPSGEIRQA